jgi:beta-glucosidase-like glycosyl hydrolase
MCGSILRKEVQVGWLDREQMDAAIPAYNLAGRTLALDAARSNMVLLKNDGGLLPLDRTKIKTLAIIGPDAFPGQPVGEAVQASFLFMRSAFSRVWRTRRATRFVSRILLGFPCFRIWRTGQISSATLWVEKRG